MSRIIEPQQSGKVFYSLMLNEDGVVDDLGWIKQCQLLDLKLTGWPNQQSILTEHGEDRFTNATYSPTLEAITAKWPLG